MVLAGGGCVVGVGAVIILGLDPGTRNIGWAVSVDGRVIAHGVFHPNSRKKVPLVSVIGQALAFVRRLHKTHKFEKVVVEEVRWRGIRAKVLFPLAHVAGALTAAGVFMVGSVVLVPPHERGPAPRLKRGATEHEKDAAALAVNHGDD